MTAVIEYVYKNVLQRARWALPWAFFVFTIIFYKRKAPTTHSRGLVTSGPVKLIIGEKTWPP
jgi:hypothetical protein